MKRTIYTVLVLSVLVIGVVISNPQDYYARGIASISNNTLPPGEAGEQDCNDTPSTATGLTSGNQTCGILSSDSDVDYYVYTIDTEGFVTFDFLLDDGVADSAVSVNICLFDSALKELHSYTKVATDFSTQKFNFSQGTRIYLRVCADKSSKLPVGYAYYIRANAVSRGDWETEMLQSESDEWKSQIKQAEQLTTAKIHGSLWKNNDQDIYKLYVPKVGKVVLDFNPNNTEGNLGWGYDLEIYKRNGKRVTFYRQIKKKTKKKFYAQKGTYYVVVKANWSNSPPPATDDYIIAATVKKSGVPSLSSKKVFYNAKTLSLKWKEIRDADGYEVQICTNRKFRKKQTVTYATIENMYQLPKRLKGKNYYVRVRAYCDTVTGDRIYGKFTKVKKIIRKTQRNKKKEK